MRTAAILILSLSLSCGWAAQSELVLASGEVVRGEIVSETEEVLVLARAVETRNKTMTVKQTYLKSKIAKITRELPTAVDLPAEYLRKAEAAESTVEAHVALLAWCRANKLVPQAVNEINQILARDATSAVALKAAAELECVEVDGRWILQSDLEATSGQAEEAKERKAAARERTKSIVQANQAKKAHQDAVARLAKVEARQALLPQLIIDARGAAENAAWQAKVAADDEARAREAGDRAQDGLNDARRNSYEESMRFYRQELAEADRRVQKAQAARKAALEKQRAAEKQVKALEAETATCAKTITATQAELDRLATEVPFPEAAPAP